MERDPALIRTRPKPTTAVDIFVDDYLVVAQGSPSRRSKVRRALFHALDKVFRTLSKTDSAFRKEPLSLKKLQKGDCSWTTTKTILGWDIDTDAMTLSLTPRRAQRLRDILKDIPLTQKRMSVTTWHKILGELRSMSLALPGARGLFSHLQEALRHVKGKRINITKSIHSTLEEFRYIQATLQLRPTRLVELVPLIPSLIGHHDASALGAGGVWFPQQNILPRPTQIDTHPDPSQPVVWRLPFEPVIRKNVVSSENPTGRVNNSELELLGGLLHKEAAAMCFDIKERTILGKTDNLATLFWERKGSVTSTALPAKLLCLQAMHQRVHRYVPRNDYIPGKENQMADDASRLVELSDVEFLTHFNNTYPQPRPWRLWTPPVDFSSKMTSLLLKEKFDRECLFNEPMPPLVTGTDGQPSALN